MVVIALKPGVLFPSSAGVLNMLHRMAVVSSWHLKPDLAKKHHVLFLPRNGRTVVPAMLRPRKHNQRGFFVSPGG